MLRILRALANKWTELLDEELEVEPPPCEGTTFTVRLKDTVIDGEVAPERKELYGSRKAIGSR